MKMTKCSKENENWNIHSWTFNLNSCSANQWNMAPCDRINLNKFTHPLVNSSLSFLIYLIRAQHYLPHHGDNFNIPHSSYRWQLLVTFFFSVTCSFVLFFSSLFFCLIFQWNDFSFRLKNHPTDKYRISLTYFVSFFLLSSISCSKAFFSFSNRDLFSSTSFCCCSRLFFIASKRFCSWKGRGPSKVIHQHMLSHRHTHEPARFSCKRAYFRFYDHRRTFKNPVWTGVIYKHFLSKTCHVTDSKQTKIWHLKSTGLDGKISLVCYVGLLAGHWKFVRFAIH